jgi:hypothetical protein
MSEEEAMNKHSQMPTERFPSPLQLWIAIWQRQLVAQRT